MDSDTAEGFDSDKVPQRLLESLPLKSPHVLLESNAVTACASGANKRACGAQSRRAASVLSLQWAVRLDRAGLKCMPVTPPTVATASGDVSRPL